MKLQRKTPSAGQQLGASRKNQWRHCIAAVAKELAPWLISAVAATAIVQCTHPPARGKVPVALKGAGAENTQQLSVATPTGKRGFVTSRSLAGAVASGLHGLGRDGAIRKDARTATDVLRTSRPPYALRKATGGFLNVPVGA